MNANTSMVTSFRPLAELEVDLLDTWHLLTQVTYRFLVLLREFDLRQGWAEWGSADCADWLNLKCGLSRNTAQEKLRTARAMYDLPQIEAAFKCGDLSYSKVRALSRVATPERETHLLDYALGATAAQVEDYCRRLRNGDRNVSSQDAYRNLGNRSLVRSFRDNGAGCISVELPREDVEIIMQALDHVSSGLPEIDGRSIFARGADALVQMARDVLAGNAGSGVAGDQYQVVVHVEESVLKNEGGESDLPAESVRRICCDASIVALVKNDRGQPLSIGRKQRAVPTAMRRALQARDRSCCFPGCTHDRWVDAHHIRHWVDGGETSLNNLMLLCTHHHRLVHEGGVQIRRCHDGTCYFLGRNRRPVEAHVSARVSAEDGAISSPFSAEEGGGGRDFAGVPAGP